MIKEFNKTLTALEKLNNYVNKEIVSLEVLKEDYQNIQDLDNLDKKTNQILSILKIEDFTDADDMRE